MSSIEENFENKSLSSFPVTPIKVKVFHGFEYPSDKMGSKSDYNEIYENSFNSNLKNSCLNEVKFSTKNGNTNSPNNSTAKNFNNNNTSLKKESSNKSFFTKRKSVISKLSENDDIYKQKEFCKKFCGEKLFKDLDLNQRFYLKKSGEVHIHNENCKFFKRQSKQNKNSSIPTKFREKRKSEVEKNLSLLDFSLAGVRSKSLMDNSNIFNNNSSSKFKKFSATGISGFSNTSGSFGFFNDGKINRTLMDDKSFSKNLNNNFNMNITINENEENLKENLKEKNEKTYKKISIVNNYNNNISNYKKIYSENKRNSRINTVRIFN